MDTTQIEINKHKTNICNLAMKLSNTYNVKEEIFINNEIKKETEFLQSFLNIKNQQQINNQFIMHQQMMAQQQLMQQNFMEQMQQQMMQQMNQAQLMKQQQFNQIFNKEEYYPNDWDLLFENQTTKRTTVIRINPNKKCFEAINMYRIKSGDKKKARFIFNNETINPELRIFETKLSSNSRIFVIHLLTLIGG